MEVIVTLDNEFEKKLLITAPWEMIGADYERLVKQYAQLPVRGFRPGKSPLALVESSFATQIKDDLLADVSMRLCRKALNEFNMVAGTPIEVSDSFLQKKEYLTFKAAFIVMPEFTLPDYTCLDLQSEKKEDKPDEISRKLLERTNISLHPRFIENELKYSENDNEEERENAEARVKLMLILKKIASQDQIEVDEKDIENRIKMVAEENAVTPKELRKFLIENNGLSRFADTLLAEAILEYITEIQNQ